MQDKSFRTAELISGYLMNSLSEEERAELFASVSTEELNQLLQHYRDVDLLKDRLQSYNVLEQHREEAWTAVQLRTKNGRVKKMRTVFIQIAAAVLVFLSLGLWLWNNKHSTKSFDTESASRTINKSEQHDMLPGTERAELVLADGRKIPLENPDDQKTGVLKNMAFDLRKGVLAYHTEGSSLQKNNAVQWHTLKVPRSGTFKLILPDGTQVWVNAYSELRFPTEFTGNERSVFLKGEAYFDVKRNPEKPFKVISDKQQIEVLGTSFNVKAYTDRPFQTTLVTGKVKLSNLNEEFTLLPGNQATMNKGKFTIKAVDLERFVSWKNGYFYFSQDQLTDVLTSIGDWYDVQIQYEGKIPNIKFGGTFSRELKLNEVLQTLADVSGCHFQINGRTLTVSNKTALNKKPIKKSNDMNN